MMEELRVDIGGRSLAVWCAGDGAPAVILETGMGAPSSDWRAVQDKVAEHTRVCYYDRANCGASDPAPTPRSARDMAEDLHALVGAMALPTPLVIAGHSFGGPIAVEYAAAWPDQVGGLVLVDPAGPDQFDIFGPMIPDFLTEMKKFWTEEWRTPEGSAERIDFHSTFDSLRKIDSLDVELIVLTSGVWQAAPTPEPHETWVRLHQHYVELSPRAEQRILDGTDHFLQRSAPDAVVKAILDVAAAVRA